jgi:pimeloyl-ACP methyl ester carboxylesterase
MPDRPEVRFTRSGTVDLAYQVIGEGPPDIVLMIGWVSHLEVFWELPEVANFIDRFAAMGRVVLFDKRGTGLSDRPLESSSYEQMVPDVLAVMDAVGMELAVLVGWVDAAALAMVVAANHPERVRAVVLGEVAATLTGDDEHPWGADAAVFEAAAEAIETGAWGHGLLLPLLAPSAAGDERILGWYRRLERMSATHRVWLATCCCDSSGVTFGPGCRESRCQRSLCTAGTLRSFSATQCDGWRGSFPTATTSKFPATRCPVTWATWTRCWTRSRNSCSAPVSVQRPRGGC